MLRNTSGAIGTFACSDLYKTPTLNRNMAFLAVSPLTMVILSKGKIDHQNGNCPMKQKYLHLEMHVGLALPCDSLF